MSDTTTITHEAFGMVLENNSLSEAKPIILKNAVRERGGSVERKNNPGLMDGLGQKRLVIRYNGRVWTDYRVDRIDGDVFEVTLMDPGAPDWEEDPLLDLEGSDGSADSDSTWQPEPDPVMDPQPNMDPSDGSADSGSSGSSSGDSSDGLPGSVNTGGGPPGGPASDPSGSDSSGGSSGGSSSSGSTLAGLDLDRETMMLLAAAGIGGAALLRRGS